MGMLRTIVAGLVHKPWEDEPETGPGAPDDWEFRVQPGPRPVLAVYNPDRKIWYLFTNVMALATVDPDEMDRNTADWHRYVELLDD